MSAAGIDPHPDNVGRLYRISGEFHSKPVRTFSGVETKIQGRASVELKGRFANRPMRTARLQRAVSLRLGGYRLIALHHVDDPRQAAVQPPVGKRGSARGASDTGEPLDMERYAPQAHSELAQRLSLALVNRRGEQCRVVVVNRRSIDDTTSAEQRADVFAARVRNEMEAQRAITAVRSAVLVELAEQIQCVGGRILGERAVLESEQLVAVALEQPLDAELANSPEFAEATLGTRGSAMQEPEYRTLRIELADLLEHRRRYSCTEIESGARLESPFNALGDENRDLADDVNAEKFQAPDRPGAEAAARPAERQDVRYLEYITRDRFAADTAAGECQAAFEFVDAGSEHAAIGEGDLEHLIRIGFDGLFGGAPAPRRRCTEKQATVRREARGIDRADPRRRNLRSWTDRIM